MSQLPQDPVPVNRRVTVHVPREVTFDLAKMSKITKDVLGRLGCEGCHSGRVLDFVTIEEFVVNAKTLEVHDVVGPTRF